MVSTKILNNLHSSLLAGFPYDYSEIKQLPIIDLVTTMGSIYYKDVNSTSRKKLNIVIPVFEPLKWNSISKEINQLANWVSGEQFNISFIQNKNSEFNNSLENFSLALPNNHSVTLFSGGLDSLTGAFRNYKNGIKSIPVRRIFRGLKSEKPSCMMHECQQPLTHYHTGGLLL